MKIPPAPVRPQLKPKASDGGKKESTPASRWHAFRETIEQIVFAFVLAFLFRTFEAEAFVIPTGSMAPTLQGRHKDVICPKCGFAYRASASNEVELDEAHGHSLGIREQESRQVVSVICPMCRYTMSVDPQTSEGREHPAYNGDRIIVAKFPYDFGEPKRWDVVVFKYPGDAKTNYIKRLVGLPQETVKISHGDIWIKPPGGSEYDIEHKDPAKLKAMLQLVYDNNYIVPEMSQRGWPARWQPWPSGPNDSTSGPKWQKADDGRSFSIDPGGSDAGAGSDQWIRYRHFVPTPEDWKVLAHGHLPAELKVAPQLITDYYAYNTFITRGRGFDSAAFGLHWVGDLMVEAKVDVKSSQGELLLDLVEGGKHFRATIDVATGQAKLAIDGLDSFKPKADTSIKGPGSYRVAFANADNQLRLWIGRKVVEFDGPTTYAPLGNDLPRSTREDAGDLAPAGIGSKGAALEVHDLSLWRDIYYIADKYEPSGGPIISDYNKRTSSILRMDAVELAEFMSTPQMWETMRPGGDNARQEVTFPLELDQFFVLGDNSPASKDSRLWDENEQYVARKLLTGKAIFIYWPHSLGRVPGVNLPFPFFPNFKAMGFVR